VFTITIAGLHYTVYSTLRLRVVTNYSPRTRYTRIYVPVPPPDSYHPILSKPGTLYPKLEAVYTNSKHTTTLPTTSTTSPTLIHENESKGGPRSSQEGCSPSPNPHLLVSHSVPVVHPVRFPIIGLSNLLNYSDTHCCAPCDNITVDLIVDFVLSTR